MSARDKNGATDTIEPQQLDDRLFPRSRRSGRLPRQRRLREGESANRPSSLGRRRQVCDLALPHEAGFAATSEGGGAEAASKPSSFTGTKADPPLSGGAATTGFSFAGSRRRSRHPSRERRIHLKMRLAFSPCRWGPPQQRRQAQGPPRRSSCARRGFSFAAAPQLRHAPPFGVHLRFRWTANPIQIAVRSRLRFTLIGAPLAWPVLLAEKSVMPGGLDDVARRQPVREVNFSVRAETIGGEYPSSGSDRSEGWPPP
jgi:hypothetical protein